MARKKSNRYSCAERECEECMVIKSRSENKHGPLKRKLFWQGLLLGLLGIEFFIPQSLGCYVWGLQQC